MTVSGVIPRYSWEVPLLFRSHGVQFEGSSPSNEWQGCIAQRFCHIECRVNSEVDKLNDRSRRVLHHLDSTRVYDLLKGNDIDFAAAMPSGFEPCLYFLQMRVVTSRNQRN